ncbi:MAG TPA: thioredoxin family protein [Thermoanaerobaculia bacterium]
MRTRSLAILVLLAVCLVGAAKPGKPMKPAGYDPKRDPAADLQAAIVEAQSSNKRVLLEVGGEWCIWCHYLNDLFTGDQEISTRLHESFVVVKVNWSPENKNEKFLSRYAKLNTFPHMFVLEKDGKLLHVENLSTIEAKNGYDRQKLLAFLDKWSPKVGAKG